MSLLGCSNEVLLQILGSLNSTALLQTNLSCKRLAELSLQLLYRRITFTPSYPDLNSNLGLAKFKRTIKRHRARAPWVKSAVFNYLRTNSDARDLVFKILYYLPHIENIKVIEDDGFPGDERRDWYRLPFQQRPTENPAQMLYYNLKHFSKVHTLFLENSDISFEDILGLGNLPALRVLTIAGYIASYSEPIESTSQTPIRNGQGMSTVQELNFVRCSPPLPISFRHILHKFGNVAKISWNMNDHSSSSPIFTSAEKISLPSTLVEFEITNASPQEPNYNPIADFSEFEGLKILKCPEYSLVSVPPSYYPGAGDHSRDLTIPSRLPSSLLQLQITFAPGRTAFRKSDNEGNVYDWILAFVKPKLDHRLSLSKIHIKELPQYGVRKVGEPRDDTEEICSVKAALHVAGIELELSLRT